MNREIKFRAWLIRSEASDKINTMRYENNDVIFDWQSNGVTMEIMQYTGLKDKNGKEIYEGDIFRLEEQTKKICDQCDGCGWYEGGKTLQTTCEVCNGEGVIFDDLDRIHYLVIVWVKEWCMFGTLHKSEYNDYLISGIEALDEPMFWTYSLEDTNDNKYFLCGNIYENPELLNQ